MQSTGQTMLLVEDVPEDIALATQALRICGHEDKIRVVRDGLEALDYLFAEGEYARRDRGLQPSVVLLDLKLPRLNGFDVLARVHSDPRTYRTPIVIHTGSQDDFDINRAYELGASSYVLKHGDFDLYCGALKKITDYWLQVNIPPVSPRFVAAAGRRARA
jgi:two-component system, response regulator